MYRSLGLDHVNEAAYIHICNNAQLSDSGLKSHCSIIQHPVSVRIKGMTAFSSWLEDSRTSSYFYIIINWILWKSLATSIGLGVSVSVHRFVLHCSVAAFIIGLSSLTWRIYFWIPRKRNGAAGIIFMFLLIVPRNLQSLTVSFAEPAELNSVQYVNQGILHLF